ncbi:MAG: 4Fe-4S binding protein [Anaerolineaceae bacterium]|jgi:formate hydrogenlyase subunit 6/NADH:ubiquinone oxidoreductase subunit I|nr:4Fe-4S binding protein [Anaerolineaceae bacterium]
MTQKSLPQINLDRCDRCSACVTGCPEQALTMTKSGPAFIEPVICTYCTECENLCPTGAIRAPFEVRWALGN